MRKTKKPIAAGWLEMAASAYIAFFAFSLFIGGIYELGYFIGGAHNIQKLIFSWTSAFIVLGIGALGFAGSIYTLKRLKWRLAFAGCVCLALAGFILIAVDRILFNTGNINNVYAIAMAIVELIPTALALAALLLIYLSKKEFGSSEKKTLAEK